MNNKKVLKILGSKKNVKKFKKMGNNCEKSREKLSEKTGKNFEKSGRRQEIDKKHRKKTKH